MSSAELFLSYHSADRASVRELQQLLKARGVSTFLDRDQLVPGLPWPQALEEALRECQAVAVLIGKDGLGEWQKKEMYFSLMRQVEEQGRGSTFPVIPILLRGARDPGAGFLFLNTWVDLTGGLENEEALAALLRALHAQAPAAALRPVLRSSPYRGLRFFREEDAAFFFGRETAARELLDLVLARDLVALVGSSGSGKSSLAQAGLLPLLRRQRPPAVWDAVCFSPEDNPFRSLARALVPVLNSELLTEADRQTEDKKYTDLFARGPAEVGETLRRCLEKWPGTDRLLVIVDQFEELFTEVGEEERKNFLAALLMAQRRLPITLLFTLRDDFYHVVTRLEPDLGQRFLKGQKNLGAMTREELGKAVTEPARRAGLDFEPGLAERILDEAGEEPGTLPLVEFALSALWERRRDGTLLLHSAYEEIGKVAGAIAATADGFMAALPPGEQLAVRRIFTRLVRVSPPEEGGRRSRQRIPLDALSAVGQEVARKLAGKRLLVLGRDGTTETVTLAHEALIQHWQRLQDWLAEDQELLLWRQRLRGSLEQWEKAGREDDALLHGALLSEAGRWLAERPDDLSAAERAFIEGSAAHRRRLQEQEDSRRRRVLASLSITAGLITLSLVAALFAWRSAVQEKSRVRTRYLGSQATVLLASRHQTALLLAVEAFQRTRRLGEPRFPPIEQALRQALAVFGGRSLGSYPGPNRRVVASPDRTRVAALGTDGKVRLWNLNAADPSAGAGTFLGPKGEPKDFEISPANRWLLATTQDAPGLLLQRLDGKEDRRESSLHSPVLRAVFSSDDHWLALRLRDEGVRLIDLTAPSLPESRSFDAVVTATAFSSDMVTAIAFSSDSRLMAVGGADGVVRLWPLDGSPEGLRASPAGGKAVAALFFGPDAGSLIAADVAGRLRRLSWGEGAAEWRELSGGVPQSLGAHDLQVSANARYLIAWSPQARGATWWDLSTAMPTGILGWVTALTVRGRWMVFGNERGQIERIDLENKRPLELIGRTVGPVPVRTLEMSRSGRLVAGGDDRFATVWDLEEEDYAQTAPPVASLGGHDDPVEVLGIGDDGRWLLTSGSAGRPPRLWGLRGGDPMAPAEPERLSRKASGLDGRWRVAVKAGEILVEDLAGPSPRLMARIREPGVVKTALSADGRWLAVSLPTSIGGNARIHLWDLRASSPARHELRSHDHGVGALAFSPDGSLLVTGGRDGTVHLWRLTPGVAEKPVALDLKGREITAATFSRDGTWLAVATDDRIVHMWRNPAALGPNALPDRRLEGAAEFLTALDFGPGSWVAAGGGEGSIYLWDRELYPGTPMVLKRHNNAVRKVAFPGDGRWLVSADEGGDTLRWRMNEDDLVSFACRTAGRNLSQQEEWNTYFPGESYRKTCPGLPPGD